MKRLLTTVLLALPLLLLSCTKGGEGGGNGNYPPLEH